MLMDNYSEETPEQQELAAVLLESEQEQVPILVGAGANEISLKYQKHPGNHFKNHENFLKIFAIFFNT